MAEASPAQVAAAMKERGCTRYNRHGYDYCVQHVGDSADTSWTERGCPVAVRVADAVVAAGDDRAVQAKALRDAADEIEGNSVGHGSELVTAAMEAQQETDAWLLRCRADRIEAGS